MPTLRKTTHNSTYPKGGVWCFYGSLVLKNPPSAKPYPLCIIMKTKQLKYKITLLIWILGYSFQLTAQTKTQAIPSELVEGENIKPFIDSLKQKILADTIKFDRKDLKHINGRTDNQNSYSQLITVNMLYSYRLDIVNGNLVKEFVNEILNSENIESINYIKKENAPILGGFMAKNGWILITLKPKVKLDFTIGGLKYRKGKKRKGGNNFLQRKNGEIMIRT